MALLRGESHNYDEIALDYYNAGLHEEACRVWSLAEECGAVSPMTYYYRALSDRQNAALLCEKACAFDPGYCFPNRLEAIIALRNAMTINAKDAKAPYYLGNLYYDKRQYDLALQAWEKSAELDSSFPTVFRNLALAYYNKQNDAQKALSSMEKAFSLDPADSRILMELDQLYKKLHKPHEERLAFLQKYPGLVGQRDDLVLEEITLLNMTGRYSEAKEKLDKHNFHPWEGGEGKVPAQYQFSRVELARTAIANGKAADAVELLKECLEYPHNLGEGKLYGAQENDFHYWIGLAYNALGRKEEAQLWLEKAAQGNLEPAAAMYYNDAKPEKIFYQGLALKELGREKQARSRFHALTSYGEKHLFDEVVMDYFAVSLPDLAIWDADLQQKNRVHCLFMLALGHYGLGEYEKSRKYFDQAYALDPDHQGMLSFKLLIES